MPPGIGIGADTVGALGATTLAGKVAMWVAAMNQIAMTNVTTASSKIVTMAAIAKEKAQALVKLCQMSSEAVVGVLGLTLESHKEFGRKLFG